MNDPTFRLEGVVREKDELSDFEGPLSLILQLLSKNKIEIRDIKIAYILDQYLNWLHEAESLDLEVASEFVQMAAYLLYIKTRTLLVTEEEVSELETLMQSLEKLKCKDALESVRSVTPFFEENSRKGFLLYTRIQEPQPKTAKEYGYRHDPADLLGSLFDVFSRGSKAPPPPDMRALAPSHIVYGVREKSRELIERLRRGDSVPLKQLYMEGKSRSEVVATFISVLELVSMGSLRIDEEDGEYTLVFAGGDTDAILDAIEE